MIRINVKKALKTNRGKIHLDVDFNLSEGDFTAISGASGAGKTTLLRMIAGLSAPDSGCIQVGDEIWFDSIKGINRPPQLRKVGFVFQDYNLFPHLSVLENLQFAAESQEDPAIKKLLKFSGLEQLSGRKPQFLSGGERQRVALIRAILRKPKIFLLDEPLSALDDQMRSKIQDEILRIYRELNITTVFVSHDISEVFKLCKQVLVLKDGRISKSGAPQDVFDSNHTSGKFKFVGEVLSIQKDNFLNIVSLQIGNTITKVVATTEEIEDIRIGERVMIASKAFNPMIIKIKP